MVLHILLALLACSDDFKDDTATDVAPDPLTVDDDGDGYTDNDGDCDDASADISPDATEVFYNGKDDDCDDATIDDDQDGDGFPSNAVGGDDCDDMAPRVNPGANEVGGNGVDDDCNARTTDSDVDGDGYNREIDCDDTKAGVNPGADEIDWNGTDENCDGQDVDLGACVDRAVRAAVSEVVGISSLPDVTEMYGPYFGYFFSREITGQLLDLKTSGSRVSAGSTANTYNLDIGTTVGLNNETDQLTINVSYDVPFVGDGFFECYGYTSPVAADFEGSVALRVSGTRVTGTSTLVADRTPISRDNLNLSPYDGSVTCSLELIEQITDAASSYITIPSIMSIFDEAAATAVNNVTVDLEGAIDAKIAVECSG